MRISDWSSDVCSSDLLDGCFDAGGRLAPDAAVSFRPLALPKYNLLRGMGQVRNLVRELAPDLLLTYNWGAIEPALANRLFGGCDHIHFESGFGAEEGSGQLWGRNLLRREGSTEEGGVGEGCVRRVRYRGAAGPKK